MSNGTHLEQLAAAPSEFLSALAGRPNAWETKRLEFLSKRLLGCFYFAAAAATYGLTILAGSTTRSNSSSVTKPSFSAAAFSVRSLSMA